MNRPWASLALSVKSGTFPRRSVVSPSLLSLPSVDSIYFAGRETDSQIAKRFKREFGIDVNTITQVRSVSESSQKIADKLSKKEIRKIGIEALRAYSQAWKSSKIENLSAHYKGYSMQLLSGRWEPATNIEHARDCTYCGERSAVTTLWNRELTNTHSRVFKDPESLAAFKKTLKVKNSVMGDADSLYIREVVDGNMNPCSDCLHVMNAGEFFMPETRMFSLCRDEANTDKPDGGYYLGFRQLSDFIPFMGKQQASLTDRPIDSLPITFSKNVKQFLNNKPTRWWKAQIRDHLKKVKSEYDEPKEFKDVKNLTDERVLVSTMLNPGNHSQMATRVDDSKRWNKPAEECAEVIAVHQFSNEENQGDLSMDLIAYYGDDPKKIPTLESLGHIATLRGGPETLLVMIENNVIQVRTIEDYMPYLYL